MRKGNNPHYRVWVNDFAARLFSTGETPEVSGVRLWLEVYAVTNGGRLPVDDGELARRGGVPVDRWMSMRDTIVADWDRDGDEWIVPNVQEQLEHQAMLSQCGRNAAAARYAQRPHSARTADATTDALRTQNGRTADAYADALPLQSSSKIEEEEPRTPPAAPSGPSRSGITDNAAGEVGDTTNQRVSPEQRVPPRTRTLPPQPGIELDDDWLAKLDRARSKLMRRDAKKAARADREVKSAVQRAGPYRGIPIRAIRAGLEAGLNHLVANPTVESWDGYLRTTVLAEAQNVAAAGSQAVAAGHVVTHEHARNGLERIGVTLSKIGGGE